MAAAEARETVAYPLKEGERVTVQVDLPDAVQAPVVQGEIAGTARFLVNGQVVGGDLFGLVQQCQPGRGGPEGAG